MLSLASAVWIIIVFGAVAIAALIVDTLSYCCTAQKHGKTILEMEQEKEEQAVKP